MSVSFLELPLDIHLYILCYVDLVDLFSLRMTCQHLNKATKQRAIWIDALRYLCKRDTVFLPSFDVHNMTLAELESAALGPKRFDSLLVNKRARVRRRIRRLDCEAHAQFIRTFLIPGGRFLVALDTTRKISIWDVSLLELTGSGAGVGGEKSEELDEDSDSGGDEDEEEDREIDGQDAAGVGNGIDPSKYLVQPLATLHTDCKSFTVNHIPDDDSSVRLLLRHSKPHIGSTYSVYDITLGDVNPQFRLVGSINVSTRHPMTFTSVWGDKLLAVHRKYAFVWNFKKDTWATWNVGRISKQILVKDEILAFIGSDDILFWKMPAMKANTGDFAFETDPKHVLKPDGRVAFPSGELDVRQVMRYKCVGLCDWYSGSPQEFWIDIGEAHPDLGFLYHRYGIKLPPPTDTTRLSDIQLISHFTFHPSHSDWADRLFPYRVCADKFVMYWATSSSIRCLSGSISKATDDQSVVSAARPALIRANDVGYRQASLCPTSGRLAYICHKPAQGGRLIVVDFLPSNV